MEGRAIGRGLVRMGPGQTFMPEMVASKTSVPSTTPWTSQTYLRPGLAVVTWPSR